MTTPAAPDLRTAYRALLDLAVVVLVSYLPAPAQDAEHLLEMWLLARAVVRALFPPYRPRHRR